MGSLCNRVITSEERILISPRSSVGFFVVFFFATGGVIKINTEAVVGQTKTIRMTSQDGADT